MGGRGGGDARPEAGSRFAQSKPLHTFLLPDLPVAFPISAELLTELRGTGETDDRRNPSRTECAESAEVRVVDKIDRALAVQLFHPSIEAPAPPDQMDCHAENVERRMIENADDGVWLLPFLEWRPRLSTFDPDVFVPIGFVPIRRQYDDWLVAEPV